MDLNSFLDSKYSQQPHYLLIGHPVSHSVSPLMHNTSLNFHEIKAGYFAVNVLPDQLTSLFAHFNSKNFLGANVTIPYKTEILPVVDELSASANSIGAVNTIVKKSQYIVGDNSDAYGFTIPLKQNSFDINTDRAIIFGTGGATKAIIFALNDLGFDEVYTVSRNAESVVSSQGEIICSYDDWQYISEEASLIINATPLGMTPNIYESPIQDSEIQLLEGKICYDIVYNPRETKFINQARKVDAYTIGGIDMLIHQGDKSFFEWTGKRFPIELVKSKINEYLSI